MRDTRLAIYMYVTVLKQLCVFDHGCLVALEGILELWNSENYLSVILVMTKTENTSILKAPVLSISRFVAMQMEAAPGQE